MTNELALYNPTDESVVVYRSEDGTLRLDVQLAEDTVWLNQQQMVALFDSTKQNVSLHINNIFKEGELHKSATVKEYLTVQTEGGRQVTCRVQYYNLDVIISVGYRLKSKRRTQCHSRCRTDRHIRPEQPLDDRWLIIDDSLYHCRHSLKDMGQKLSAISLMGTPAQDIINQVR